MISIEELRSGDYFEDELFDGLDLQAESFSGKDFYRCTFRNLNLQESRWGGARLEDCAFEGCDLTRMVPGDLRAQGASFKGCKLMGIEWSATALAPQLSFEDCDLRYASFVSVSLKRTPFLRCKLTEGNLIDVDLTEADFSGTDLTGSTIQGANLTRAEMSTTVGAFIDPAKNRVKDARISVDSAVLLAAFFGMKIGGFAEASKSPAPARRGGRRR